MQAATAFVLAYGTVLALVLLAFAEQIAAIMTANGTAAAFTADYLRIVGWSLAGYGMTIAANAAMTGRSRAGSAMGLSLARILLIYVPFAYLGATTFGFTGVLLAAALANVFAFWAALVATRANEIGPSEAAWVTRPANWLPDRWIGEPGQTHRVGTHDRA
jgi:Na+-driven multidrug efflux pump